MMWFLQPKYADLEYRTRMRRLQYHLLRQIGVSSSSAYRLRDFRPRNFFLCFQRALNKQEDCFIRFEVKK